MSSRKKAPDGMYTAGEAIEIIDIPSTAFYDLVNDGVIKRIVLPGKKEGFYARQEIDRYARNIKALSAPYQGGKLDFGLALAEDLPAVFDLVASVSGGPNHAVPQEVLKAWIRKNPQSIHVMRRQNEIIGYVSGFILPMETLLLRLDGTLLNREIPIDDIQPFDASIGVPYYLAEMAVKPSQKSIDNGTPTPDDHLGLLLIRNTARFIFHDLKTQGVHVNELYAVGSSEFGINLCHKLGMHPMALTKGVRSDRMPCKVNLDEASESLLLNRFLKRLAAA